jgi:hypothetical protein
MHVQAQAACGNGGAGSSPLPLADRIADALTHHEPGWRLPRPIVLARRYSASPPDVHRAVDELIAQHLVRRLPDGQLFKSSPAEALVPLGGVAGLGARLDPMGCEIICRSCHTSSRQVPRAVSDALGIALGEPACVVELVWTSNDEPVAVSTTYLAGPAGLEDAPAWRPSGLAVELRPAPSDVAAGLKLRPGEPALLVTLSFHGDDAAGAGRAITATALRPEMFRVSVESSGPCPVHRR